MKKNNFRIYREPPFNYMLLRPTDYQRYGRGESFNIFLQGFKELTGARKLLFLRSLDLTP